MMMFNELSQSILMKLKLRNQLPKKIEYTHFSNRHWFASYDILEDNVMSESSTAGMDFDREIALLKALSEKVERNAYTEGYKQGNTACMTERSDGFAAYPRICQDAHNVARSNALNEAIERYVWATWWDNEDIRFKTSNTDHSVISEECSIYLLAVKEKCGLVDVTLVIPEMQLTDSMVFILIGKRCNGGYISGGACGFDSHATISRAIDELFRHGLAANKLSNDKREPSSFYEKRLNFFLKSEGQQLVENRLSKHGSTKVILPDLAIDHLIEHSLADLYTVHRCLFLNQPQFMGGNLERFCL